METLSNLSINDAKRLAKKVQAEAVIVLAFDSHGRFSTISYGKDRATCEQYGKVLDQIANDLSNGFIVVPEKAEEVRRLASITDVTPILCPHCGGEIKMIER